MESYDDLFHRLVADAKFELLLSFWVVDEVLCVPLLGDCRPPMYGTVGSLTGAFGRGRSHNFSSTCSLCGSKRDGLTSGELPTSYPQASPQKFNFLRVEGGFRPIPRCVFGWESPWEMKPHALQLLWCVWDAQPRTSLRKCGTCRNYSVCKQRRAGNEALKMLETLEHRTHTMIPQTLHCVTTRVQRDPRSGGRGQDMET